MWFEDRHVKAVDRLPNGHAERITGATSSRWRTDETIEHVLRFLVA